MKITDKRDLLSPLIEGGDLILIPNGALLIVVLPADVGSELVALLNVETGRFYIPEGKSSAWFNHPQHMRNHLKKHYETYQHIKNQQVEVIIHDKTY